METIKNGLRQDRLDLTETLAHVRDSLKEGEEWREEHTEQHGQLTAFQRGQRATFINIGAGFKVLVALGGALFLGLQIFIAIHATQGDTLTMIPAVTCATFPTQKQAQAFFDAKVSGYTRLDGDGDGVACEDLP